MKFPSLLEVFRLYEENLRLMHGSSFGGITSFEGFKPPVFFTEDRREAKRYATGDVIMTQRASGHVGEKRPTIYDVEISDATPFDLRKEEHRKIYESLRSSEEILKKLPTSVYSSRRHVLPDLGEEGFIAHRTRLPMFSFVRPIWRLLQAGGRTNFDSIWVDEGSQGISIALFDLKKAKITGEEQL